MLRPRIIPCLLIQDGSLVKTRQFSSPKYIGDPINAVRIFNEKKVDEIVVFDINASTRGSVPDYDLIKRIADECRMPMCYGGGVFTLDQIERIVCLGVEKVSISSQAVKTPDLISRAAQRLGSQSVAVTIDVKKNETTGNFEVVLNNGNTSTGMDPSVFALKMKEHGAGEVIINDVDADGMMNGYNEQLIANIDNSIDIPFTVLGGAGSLADMESLVRRFGSIGCGAGSIFVFKGKHKAVLINYPDESQKDLLFSKFLCGVR